MSDDKLSVALEFYKNDAYQAALANLDVFSEDPDVLSLKTLIYFKQKDYTSLSYILNTYLIPDEYKFLIHLMKTEKFSDYNLNYLGNYNLGVYYLNNKQYRKALSCFSKSVEEKSDFIVAVNNNAIVLEILNRQEEAVSILNKACQLSNDNEFIKLNLWLLENGTNLEMVKPLQINKNYYRSNLVLIVNYLIYYFYSIGENKRAISLSERFLSNSNYFRYIWHNRATLLHKIGSRTQATASYVKAILSSPNIYTIYNMHIATIELLKFNPQKALERIIEDYVGVELIYFYASLFFLRNRDLQAACLYMEKACNFNALKYEEFLLLLKNNNSTALDMLLDQFALSLQTKFELEYLFFIDNTLNLRNPVFVFDYELKINTYVWKIRDEYLELKPNSESKLCKELLETELKDVSFDITIEQFKNMLESFKEFYSINS